MSELTNNAEIKYEFLTENKSSSTNNVTTYVNIDEGFRFKEFFLLPKRAPQIHMLNIAEIHTEKLCKIPFLPEKILKIEFFIKCKYKDEYFFSQSYMMIFHRIIKANCEFVTKNACLKIDSYKLITKRLLEFDLKICNK